MRMAKASLLGDGHEDGIMASVAFNLRERAATYRAKGYAQIAIDLEREAAEAEWIAARDAAPAPDDAQPRPRLVTAARSIQAAHVEPKPSILQEDQTPPLLRSKYYTPRQSQNPYLRKTRYLGRSV